jgi:predicted ATPase
MPDLPTGTVTFLFTDIEGSTRLLDELAGRYADALAEHRRVLRRAFRRQRGVEVDTQGDAFFVAFERASDAVAAAEEAQAALAAGPIRVRIGIHTGEPTVTEEGYVGIDVHRGARIAAAAHGGQVLVSRATRELVENDLRDLGLHRLKDVGELRLFQLGAGRFPPPRTLDAVDLPIPPTPLVGRGQELADLLRLIREERARLVTVTGPGGIGKTRVALEAASELVGEFPHGVWFVDLSALRDPALVLPSVASATGAKGGLAEHVGDRETLIVLDNLEQVTGAAPELARLLSVCPRLVLLVTSREPLRVGGEREYPLRPLADEPAVELFRERARSAVPELAAEYGELVELCRRLDGLPLAIELAAARTKLLSPAKLLERLEQRLPLLAGGRRDVPERQRTLRATIQWSYELLGEDEQTLFARLAVFAGGFALEAAEEVCEADLDTLESLVQKSLVGHDEDRFTMLETIREYALERLEKGNQARRLRSCHAEYFLALAEQAETELEGPEQGAWFARLEEEHANLRAALQWAAERGETELALRLAGALAPFWWVRGYWTEGRHWSERALSSGADQPPAQRAKVLEGAGHLAARQWDFPAATSRVEESLAIRRALADRWGVARSLRVLGTIAGLRGDAEQADALHEESARFAREVGDLWTLSMDLNNLGYQALVAGDHERARELFEESLALGRERGDDRGLSVVLANLGLTSLQQGRFHEGLAHFAESLRLASHVGYREIIGCDLEGIAAIAAEGGDAEAAARLLGGTEVVLARTGGPRDWIEQTVHEQTLNEVRRHLDEETLAAAWAAGSTLAPDELVKEALRRVDARLPAEDRDA